LLAARAEKVVLRMSAAESTIFAVLDIIRSPWFVRRRALRDGTPDKIDKCLSYSRAAKAMRSLHIILSSPVSEAYEGIFSGYAKMER
jgi:hypothetical protein